jgi:hypothetical protein
MKLRIDPWDPEYGASAEIDVELEEPVGLELAIEVDGPWQPIEAPPREGLPCCAFVDGVRRIDARLFAEDGEAQAPGLAGSWAVGGAWSTRPPKIDGIVVGRELVLGGGLAHPPLPLTVGPSELLFAPSAVPGSAPLDPLRGLQNAMREAEAKLAEDILSSGDAELAISDGPLNYFLKGPAIGMIKRQSRSYLDPDRSAVIANLARGQRTPIFKLGEQRLERYSWYLRLVGQRAIDGTMSGVVRLEVAAVGGLETAQRLADLAGAVLPRFASQPGRDPRAPQNLYPVGALESVLRHRLGDAFLIRRALESHLYAEVQRA